MVISKLSAQGYRRIGAPDHVLDWVVNGVKLPFTREPNHCFYKNRINGFKQSVFVDSQGEKLVNDGAVKEVNYKPKCILALQCVPKKGGKLRLVLDCRPINNDMKTPKFTQEGVTVVSELIEAEDELITIDLEEGFHHIGVHVSHQKYLGFMWKGKYYVWIALPFGVQCAPYYFNKILKPAITYIRENNVRITPFVDDMLVMAKSSQMTDHKDFVVQTLQELGWHLNWKKCQLTPSKECIFVGFVISTCGEPWIKVMSSKIRKLKRSIALLLEKQHVGVRQLARVLGQCISMTKAIIPGKLLLRNCYRVLATKKHWEDNSLVLSQAAKEDLKWWSSALKSWNGAPLSQREVEIQVETDASSLGLGKLYRKKHFGSRRMEQIRKFSTLELQRTAGSLDDNKVISSAVGWKKSPNFVGQCNDRGLYKSVRGNKSTFVRFNDYNLGYSSREKHHSLSKGKCTIDRFVSMRSTQLKRYNSLYWDPHTEAVDAMAQENWNKELNFCNPPFWMINRVLRKIEQQQAEAILIAPLWKSKEWFKKLMKMAIDYPVRIKNSHRTVLKLAAKPEPLKNKKWRLCTWRISGKKN